MVQPLSKGGGPAGTPNIIVAETDSLILQCGFSFRRLLLLSDDSPLSHNFADCWVPLDLYHYGTVVMGVME